ncbi:hypothetical protein KSP35_05390 [Aquihabitans sp. G128]|uniref:hypothetical protein n=1 Tax=Aquihabitans sp. G128 TaxID=2849779 RepID=UPI001C218572|nr:hypothetical protein [Aquihabitans sp. G128]QXC62242.1 hypothetical protein KSP35_05390 [Aquihabitans sp. G128]
MSWNTVERGFLADGSAWRIERRTLVLPVPKSSAVLPIQLRSYRWLLVDSAGRTAVRGRSRDRHQLEAEIGSIEA